MSNIQIEQIKKYIKETYDLDFKLETYNTHSWIYYKKNKKEYQLNCQYCFDHKKEEYVWCICYDFMDKIKWSGYGYFERDNGFKTVDYIMSKWGFKKIKNQVSIFDIIGD